MSRGGMQVWFSASELAELAAGGALQGLPATRQGINALAAREAWEAHAGLCRARAGQGGGLEYHLDVLPLSTRLAWIGRHFPVTEADTTVELDDAPLSGRARAQRDAKRILVRLADRLKREQHLSVMAADSLFSALFNAGRIDLPAWLKAEVRSLSARSLARWRAAAPEALAYDPAAARKGTGRLDRALDGRVRAFVLAAIAKKPFISATDVRNLIMAEFGALIAVPPLRTVQQTLRAWREEYRNELTYLTDPDRYRSAVELSATGATRADRLNQLWQIDASPADVLLTDGRHSVYVAIDAYSRRMTILVSKTPRAAAVGLLMRKAMLAWGVPEKIKTDNGSDFTAFATRRLFAALGIEVELSPPYQPRTKGMVERAIGTFQRSLAGLPGFAGHNVADRKKIEGRKAFAQRLGADPAELLDIQMDAAEFQAWCDEWAGAIYGTTRHSTLGTTPNLAAAGWAGEVRRIADEAALAMLLAPVPGRDGLRRVTKNGVRGVDGEAYITHAVAVGTDVLCRYDPADLGRMLLFSPDGETYLGEAVNPVLAGLDPVETIQKARAMQKALLDERIKPIRAEMRKIGPRAVADAMRHAAAQRAGNIVSMPQRPAPHTTPELDAAAAAARGPQAKPLVDRAAELHASMTAPGKAREASVTVLPETREQRFARALGLERRLSAGQPVSEAEFKWLSGYREDAEYRAMSRMMADFGAEALRL